MIAFCCVSSNCKGADDDGGGIDLGGDGGDGQIFFADDSVGSSEQLSSKQVREGLARRAN